MLIDNSFKPRLIEECAQVLFDLSLEVTQLKSGDQRSSTFGKSRTSAQVRNSYIYKNRFKKLAEGLAYQREDFLSMRIHNAKVDNSKQVMCYNLKAHL